MSALIVSLTFLVFLVGVAIVDHKGMPVAAFFGSLVIFTLISSSSAWMLARVLLNIRAHNGSTTMPVWFIQVFGLILFAGICVVAVKERHPLLFAECAGVAFAMLGIRRLLKAGRVEVGEA
jgi:hypothetical protein